VVWIEGWDIHWIMARNRVGSSYRHERIIGLGWFWKIRRASLNEIMLLYMSVRGTLIS